VISCDDSYGAVDVAHGSEPNNSLVAPATRIRPIGRVVSLGEGEGRSAVWLDRPSLWHAEHHTQHR